MVRTKQTAKESTGGKAPPTPRHLRNRDVLLRKGQYFTPAALKRTRRQFLLARLFACKVYHGVAPLDIQEGGAGALQEDAEGAQQMHMHHGLWVA